MFKVDKFNLIFAIFLILIFFQPTFVLALEILPTPLQQIKKGVSFQDVRCKAGLELIYKATDGSPACVSILTKDKLVYRGWALNDGLGSKFAIGGIRSD